MNKQLKNIISIFIISLLFTLVSCNGITNSETKDDKVILKFSVADTSRTVFPESPSLTEFTNISLSISHMSKFGYRNIVELQQDIKTFSSDEISFDETYGFSLTAYKGQILYSAYVEQQLTQGENVINFELKRNTLGEGNGNIDISLDLSKASNHQEVNHIDITVISLENHSIVYSDTISSTEIDDSYKINFNKTNIPCGNYNVEAKFYATEGSNALMLRYPFVVVVAQDLTSRDTIDIDKLNPVYNITFDMNVEDPENILFDYEANSKITRLTRERPAEPQRDGYIFMGWRLLDNDYDEPQELTFPVTSDITLIASWLDSSTSDGSYLATEGTVEGIILSISEGTKTEPAVVRLRGMIDRDVFGIIQGALQHNSDVYFEIDIADITQIEPLDYCGIQDCPNLIKIHLPLNYYIESNVFRGCSSLKEIEIQNIENSSFRIINGVLYLNRTDGLQLLIYPAGLGGNTFNVSNEIASIAEYAFDSSSLTEINIPDSVYSLSNKAFSNCANLAAVNVDEENQNYSSSNGVLYSKDGTKLIYYPQGIEELTFTIPETVKTIAPRAFFWAENLHGVVVPSGSTWFETEWITDNNYDLIQYGTLMNFEDPYETLDQLREYYETREYTYIKVNINSLLAGELTVYEYEENFDISDSSYTKLTLTGDTTQMDYRLYKIQTVPGKKYIMDLVDSQTSGKYSYTDDYHFGNTSHIFMNNDFSFVNGQGSKQGPYEDLIVQYFTAQTEYTYLLIWGEKDIALRVCEEPAIKKAVNLSMGFEDIGLRYNDKGEAWEWYITNQHLFDSYPYTAYWFVDNKLYDGYGTNYRFDPSEYEPGIHLISVQVEAYTTSTEATYYSAAMYVTVE